MRLVTPSASRRASAYTLSTRRQPARPYKPPSLSPTQPRPYPGPCPLPSTSTRTSAPLFSHKLFSSPALYLSIRMPPHYVDFFVKLCTFAPARGTNIHNLTEYCICANKCITCKMGSLCKVWRAGKPRGANIPRPVLNPQFYAPHQLRT